MPLRSAHELELSTHQRAVMWLRIKLATILLNAVVAHARVQAVIGSVAREPCSRNEAKSPTTKGSAEAVSLEISMLICATHRYLYRPARDVWPAAASMRGSRRSRWSIRTVNQCSTNTVQQVTQPASAWPDVNRAVEQMTWAPGMPERIVDQLIAEGGWIKHRGGRL